MKKLIAFICGLLLIFACSKTIQNEKFDQAAYSTLEENIDSLIVVLHNLESVNDNRNITIKD